MWVKLEVPGEGEVSRAKKDVIGVGLGVLNGKMVS